mgnify:CR=1 FL=1
MLFDVLAERYEFPLVPYVKLGYAYGIWWATNGLGNLARATTNGTTTVARGGTGGFDATLGLRFLLDVLEPGAARSFDIEMGVNHSYLFGEYRHLVLTDWGSSSSIDLSDGIWNFGLGHGMLVGVLGVMMGSVYCTHSLEGVGIRPRKNGG